MTENFTDSNVAKQRTAIKEAVLNVAKAMTNAGYSSTQYTIMMQNYPSPIPNGEGFRYSQKGYTRQEVGGCGFWNHDATKPTPRCCPRSTARSSKGPKKRNSPT